MNSVRTLKNILLVDDEPDILTVAEIALSRVGGLEVHAYSSSQKALDEVENIKPDLIILDMMMPVLDGMQTLARLKNIKSLSEVPVIFMTAKVQQNEIDAYIKAGAADVINKPFDPMKLAEKVREVWESNGVDND